MALRPLPSAVVQHAYLSLMPFRPQQLCHRHIVALHPSLKAIVPQDTPGGPISLGVRKFYGFSVATLLAKSASDLVDQYWPPPELETPSRVISGVKYDLHAKLRNVQTV